MEITCRVYKPRDPRKAPLYGLLDSLYERVKGVWEERFERSYGFWRGLVPDGPSRGALGWRWAESIRRVYEADPLVCPRWGREMRMIGFIAQPAVIDRILDHLRKRDKVPRPPPLSPAQRASPA